MNNEKVVSEKEIIGTIDDMEECIDEIRSFTNNMNGLVGEFSDLLDNLYSVLNTSSSVDLLSKLKDNVNSLERKQKVFSNKINNFLLNIEYTQSMDNTVKEVIDGQ